MIFHTWSTVKHSTKSLGIRNQSSFWLCHDEIYLLQPWDSAIFQWSSPPYNCLYSPLYTLLTTTDSLSVPPESHVIPWKSSTFPLPNSPHPQAIKIDCSLILLWTVFQNFSSKMKYEKHSLEYVDLPMYWTSLDDRRSLFDTYGPFHLDILGLQKRDTKKT